MGKNKNQADHRRAKKEDPPKGGEDNEEKFGLTHGRLSIGAWIGREFESQGSHERGGKGFLRHDRFIGDAG